MQVNVVYLVYIPLILLYASWDIPYGLDQANQVFEEGIQLEPLFFNSIWQVTDLSLQGRNISPSLFQFFD